MLSKENILAQSIIGFYADKNVDCSVVAEKNDFLIILRTRERMHEFRCKTCRHIVNPNSKNLLALLEQEFEKFMAQPVPVAH